MLRKENTINYRHLGMGMGYICVGVVLSMFYRHAGLIIGVYGSLAWVLPEILLGEPIK